VCWFCPARASGQGENKIRKDEKIGEHVERNLRRRLSVRVEERACWCLSSRGAESEKKGMLLN
jgi:hypothetical protein